MVTLRWSALVQWYLTLLMVTWLQAQEDTGLKCPRPVLKNGMVKPLSEGKIARFKCWVRFRLIGPKYSTCVNGKWDSEMPLCVQSGCMPFRTPAHGRKVSSFRNAVIFIECEEDFVLSGSPTLFCDGTKWNGTVPICIPKDKEPVTFCDFDNEDLCGWSQDSTDNADWIQHNHNVPSRSIGTGPKFDHTFGEGLGGLYMYAESSSPRVVNDSARLLSPLYPASIANNGSCFIFWYHMFGATMGSLRVYQREANEMLNNINLSMELIGDKGDEWRQALIMLKPSTNPFQLVFEAVRGHGYLSDIAIDDVSLASEENCTISTQPFDEVADSGSCQYRCGKFSRAQSSETPAPPTCSCEPQCKLEKNCCHDYIPYCDPESVTDNIPLETSEIFDIPPTTTLLPTTSTTKSSISTLYPVVTPTIPSTTTMKHADTSIFTKSPSTTLPASIITSVTIKNQTISTLNNKNVTIAISTTPSKFENNTTSSIRITSIKPISKQMSTVTKIIPSKSTTRMLNIKSTSKTIPTTSTKNTRKYSIYIRTTKTTTRITSKTSPMSTKIITSTSLPFTTTIKLNPVTTRTKASTIALARSTQMELSNGNTSSVIEVDNSPGLVVLISAIFGALLLLLLVSVTTFSVVRRQRQKSRRMRGLYSDDSDVRFLTASDGEIQLDFSLATPSD